MGVAPLILFYLITPLWIVNLRIKTSTNVSSNFKKLVVSPNS
jgi:hypothetical protein